MSRTRVAKMSKLYAPTLKEDPAEAELASHRLLLRAGMIRKSLRVSTATAARVALAQEDRGYRARRDGRAGAQEMLVPILTDGELWRESGRSSAYGPELMRLKDRHDRTFCLGHA